MNESDNKMYSNTWKELMNKYDLIYFTQFQILSNYNLKQIREDWKAMRKFALNKLNKELNDSGKSGKLLSIDVSDEELYPYFNNKNKITFFKYSRILDFDYGYKPTNLNYGKIL